MIFIGTTAPVDDTNLIAVPSNAFAVSCLPINANNKFSALMNMHGTKQIGIGYFAELEQKPGYESCEFDMDNDELTVIRTDGVLKVVSNASTKTAKQIMDVIQK